MIILKQSTASQSVLLGPFLDSTDGITAETGLTVNNTDIRISKAGANIVAKNSGGGTHDENGWYTITLDATDTNTVGVLQIHSVMSGALPVFLTAYVVEETIYDAFFGSSAAGEFLVALSTTGKSDVNAECDTALSDYDAPTKAEMDTAFTEIKGATWATTDTLENIRDEQVTLDTVADGIKAVTDLLPDSGALTSLATAASISALNDVSTAQVNAEVVDALSTDTYAEPAGVPAATASLKDKIGYLYMALRNKVEVTATKKTFYDDTDAAEWEKDLSDDGTTYTESEANAI